MTTAQEIFNTAYLGIIEQGGPSMNAFGSCMYRGLNGRKCAVGHLLSDEEAALHEGKNWASVWCLELDPTHLKTFGPFLSKLQAAHDDAVYSKSDFFTLFKQNMITIANEYDLEVPDDA